MHPCPAAFPCHIAHTRRGTFAPPRTSSAARFRAGGFVAKIRPVVIRQDGSVTLRIHWFLPTGGDSADVVGGSSARREPDLAYLAQVAGAADRLGYDGVLTPCGTSCEDAWLATAA